MENYKNGVISEEALEEVAGGLKINKDAVKKVLIGAGIGIISLGAGIAINIAGTEIVEHKDDIAKGAKKLYGNAKGLFSKKTAPEPEKGVEYSTDIHNI